MIAENTHLARAVRAASAAAATVAARPDVTHVPRTLAQLAESDVFTPDGGTTWHTCAVPMPALRTVAVYLDDTREDDSPTMRISIEGDGPLLVAVP